MKTYMAKTGDIAKKWYVVDADGKIFGRLAAKVASVLMGKGKPEFTPNVDTGDYVVVVNASKLVFTGNKLDQKKYYSHSGYPGGLKEVSYRHLMETKPDFAFREAVRRMLPKNKLGKSMINKLFVYVDAEHKQQAQNPAVLDV